MYLVGLGASITLTGAALGLLDIAHSGRAGRAGIAIVVAVLVAGLASFVAVARDITRDFEPFGPIVLAHDDIVRTWSPVPPELRDYVARKREPDARNRVSSNPLDELSAGHVRGLRTRKESGWRAVHVDEHIACRDPGARQRSQRA